MAQAFSHRVRQVHRVEPRRLQLGPDPGGSGATLGQAFGLPSPPCGPRCICPFPKKAAGLGCRDELGHLRLEPETRGMKNKQSRARSRDFGVPQTPDPKLAASQPLPKEGAEVPGVQTTSRLPWAGDSQESGSLRASRGCYELKAGARRICVREPGRKLGQKIGAWGCWNAALLGRLCSPAPTPPSKPSPCRSSLFGAKGVPGDLAPCQKLPWQGFSGVGPSGRARERAGEALHWPSTYCPWGVLLSHFLRR